MIPVLDTITAGLNAVASWFGFQGKRQERMNAPDVVANANAKRDAKEADAVVGEVQRGDKTGNLDQERKDFSE